MADVAGADGEDLPPHTPLNAPGLSLVNESIGKLAKAPEFDVPDLI
jgi:hypothetical protein